MLKEGNNNALDEYYIVEALGPQQARAFEHIEGCFGMFFMYIKKALRSISIYMLALTGKTVSPQNIFFLFFFKFVF